MRVIVCNADGTEIAADTQLNEKNKLRVFFPRPAKVVRIAYVKQSPLDRKGTLCLMFE